MDFLIIIVALVALAILGFELSKRFWREVFWYFGDRSRDPPMTEWEKRAARDDAIWDDWQARKADATPWWRR
jgi:hypothetical protein